MAAFKFTSKDDLAMDENTDGTGKRGFRPKAVSGAKQQGARGFVLSPEGAFIHQNGKLETLADAVDFFWAGVARDPAAWSGSSLGYDYLLDHAAEASREDVRRALGWLELAIARRDRGAAVAAARYLAVIPAPLLACDYGRLLGIFNSRILGMVWQMTPDLDVKPLPPRIPTFGREAGFGLIRSVPELYEMLALLGLEMEEVVLGIASEAMRYGISLPPSLAALCTASPPRPSATG